MSTLLHILLVAHVFKLFILIEKKIDLSLYFFFFAGGEYVIPSNTTAHITLHPDIYIKTNKVLRNFILTAIYMTKTKQINIHRDTTLTKRDSVYSGQQNIMQ